MINFLTKKYPQNYVIRKPITGSAIILLLNFIFIVTYRPFNVHPARTFSFGFTMLVYSLLMAVPVVLLASIIKFKSKKSHWTFLKEITSILILLAGMGISVYFSGFIMEEPSDRWNLSTFVSSFLIGILVGLVPFSFFTLSNYRHLFVTDISQVFSPNVNSQTEEDTADFIEIPSQLKKEEVSLFPKNIQYIESQGNYVIFYMIEKGVAKKLTVRNTMNNIEQHLSEYPYLKKVHRAFMVNLHCIKSIKGNTWGYKIKLTGAENEIPVSRQNSVNFMQIVKQYH